jgi:dTDP-4-dehydrorhamnose reductase
VSVIVLGAHGLLGRHVVEELGGAVTRFGHAECDITRDDRLRDVICRAHLVINCAGFTNVDGAEKDEAGAYRVNALGTENVARAAAAAGAKLVHVSTDFVFDGAESEPYDEFARPNPLSVYARSKWVGEELARRAASKLFVVRVQGLYGRGGGNFSSKLRQLLLDGKTLKLDGERRVQPTWARAAARQIVKLALTDHYGTYHVSCKGETTWAGFAARLAEKLGVAPSWQVVRSDELQAPAARPPNCLFRHRMLELRGVDVMRDWQVALDEYLAEEARA